MNSEHPFATLSPDRVFDAIESTGLITDLRILALNSYENRVYQIGIEDGEPIIAKFYRPERWSDTQILEEHLFSAELAAAEIPVVPPLTAAEISPGHSDSGQTLFHYQNFRFALYRRYGGHAPELDDPDTLLVLGRLMGRIHNIGKLRPFSARPSLTVQRLAIDSYQFLHEHFIPPDLATPYRTLAEDLIERLQALFSAHPPALLRSHGDCHPGNILWRNDSAHFVDLDDCCMAPALQDIWMLLSGDRQQQTRQLNDVMEGYREFCDFNPRELQLLEALRTLRIMYYAAWLARRWNDPTFPASFPWFNSARYWSEHILELREQLALLQEPPLVLF